MVRIVSLVRLDDLMQYHMYLVEHKVPFAFICFVLFALYRVILCACLLYVCLFCFKVNGVLFPGRDDAAVDRVE